VFTGSPRPASNSLVKPLAFAKFSIAASQSCFVIVRANSRHGLWSLGAKGLTVSCCWPFGNSHKARSRSDNSFMDIWNLSVIGFLSPSAINYPDTDRCQLNNTCIVNPTIDLVDMGSAYVHHRNTAFRQLFDRVLVCWIKKMITAYI